MSFAVYSIQKSESSNEEAIAEVGPYLEGIDPVLIAEIEAIEKVIDVTEVELVAGNDANQPFRACLYTLSGVTQIGAPPYPSWLGNGGQICFAPAAPGSLCPSPIPGQGPYRIVWNGATVGSAQDFFASSSSNQLCPNTAGRRVILSN
jgi:hypothetical protein